MVVPFFGCAFGGLLYDLFIYTGESPVNTPWIGKERVIQGDVLPRAHSRACSSKHGHRITRVEFV